MIDDPLEIVPPRTIMMVGATGAGKSTLIDGLVNYVLGVEWTDDYRFTIIDHKDEEKTRTGNQALSQTSWITVYKIPRVKGSKLSCPLQIVDMPGFGDTDGVEKDRELIERLRQIFNAHPALGGIIELDLVCFVIRASQNRLTARELYMFHSLQTIFDKSITDNICPFITFADGNTPEVLSCLKEAKMPCKKYFTFNNSALFARDPENRFTKIFWEMGEEFYLKTVQYLMEMETKSLLLSKELMNKRRELSFHIKDLRQKVQTGIDELEGIIQERSVLERHRDDIEANKDFEYEVYVPARKKISTTQNATNCNICQTTCHSPCYFGRLTTKICDAIDISFHCTVCPQKCSSNDHVFEKYTYITESVSEKRTFANIKKRYDDALRGSTRAVDVLQAHQDHFYATQDTVENLMKEVLEKSNRLKEIEMDLTTISGVEYIELMWATEIIEKKTGYKKRLQMLEDALDEYKLMESVTDKKFDPWGKYLEDEKIRNTLTNCETENDKRSILGDIDLTGSSQDNSKNVSLFRKLERMGNIIIREGQHTCEVVTSMSFAEI